MLTGEPKQRLEWRRKGTLGARQGCSGRRDEADEAASGSPDHHDISRHAESTG
jgi:hypothetical protein